MDLDDVSIVCENEDINVEKDVKVKLILFKYCMIFIQFCVNLIYGVCIRILMLVVFYCIMYVNCSIMFYVVSFYL